MSNGTLLEQVAIAINNVRAPETVLANLSPNLQRKCRAEARAAIDVIPIDTGLEDWINYANKLEAALKLACGQTSDRLMRMHAEQGLRIVRPTPPDYSLTDPSTMPPGDRG